MFAKRAKGNKILSNPETLVGDCSPPFWITEAKSLPESLLTHQPWENVISTLNRVLVEHITASTKIISSVRLPKNFSKLQTVELWLWARAADKAGDFKEGEH